MIVIGVDVGGTAMRAVLYDDDSERARVAGVGSPMRVGGGQALALAISQLVKPLLMRSRSVRADALIVGAAGAGRESERNELAAALDRERLAWKVVVTTDAELARAAAFAGGAGVLLIAGTGSIAMARDARGTIRRVGGLGWRMGDQGSAYWIGTRALEAVGSMHDGNGPVTRLAEHLCAAIPVAGMAGLIQWSTVAAPAQVAALAPVVLEAAERGDQVAIGVRDAAAAELARMAITAGGSTLPVALSGGLLAPDRPLRRLVVERLMRQGVTVRDGVVDPCSGAPVLAREATA